MRVLLIAIMVAVVGCHSHQFSPKATNAPVASELEVMVSFLAQCYDDYIKNNTPLVIQDTFSIAALREGHELHDEFTKSLLAQASEEVPAELIRDFCAKSAS